MSAKLSACAVHACKLAKVTSCFFFSDKLAIRLYKHARVSNDDIGGYLLKSDVERLLINQKILKDISLLNHSCAPNAAIGLHDFEEKEEPEKRFELRALKEI